MCILVFFFFFSFSLSFFNNNNNNKNNEILIKCEPLVYIPELGALTVNIQFNMCKFFFTVYNCMPQTEVWTSLSLVYVMGLQLHTEEKTNGDWDCLLQADNFTRL